MKNNHVFLTLALLTCFAAPQKVLADEMWKTKEYNVIYQTDRNKTAIWSYGRNRLIFIDGLAGVTTNRGSYSGYWAQDRDRSSVRCDTYREGANGKFISGAVAMVATDERLKPAVGGADEDVPF